MGGLAIASSAVRPRSNRSDNVVSVTLHLRSRAQAVMPDLSECSEEAGGYGRASGVCGRVGIDGWTKTFYAAPVGFGGGVPGMQVHDD